MAFRIRKLSWFRRGYTYGGSHFGDLRACCDWSVVTLGHQMAATSIIT